MLLSTIGVIQSASAALYCWRVLIDWVAVWRLNCIPVCCCPGLYTTVYSVPLVFWVNYAEHYLDSFLVLTCCWSKDCVGRSYYIDTVVDWLNQRWFGVTYQSVCCCPGFAHEYKGIHRLPMPSILYDLLWQYLSLCHFSPLSYCFYLLLYYYKHAINLTKHWPPVNRLLVRPCSYINPFMPIYPRYLFAASNLP